MIALDTNVLVRYLVEDDPDQTQRSAKLIEDALAKDEHLFVPQIVLCEIVWVLGSAYGLSKAEVVTALRGLTRARQLDLEDTDSARRALDAFEAGGGDFADYLIGERAREAGCDRVATFDRALLEEEMFFCP